MCHDAKFAGHFGKNKTQERVGQHFYWKGWKKDVVRYCDTCQSCQEKRKPRAKASLMKFPVPSRPFERLGLDILGPLPRTDSGNQYIAVFCDYLT